jgi:hypothetical protein
VAATVRQHERRISLRVAGVSGVFKRFRDLTFFREFRVDEEIGTLTWSGEIDIAPETLYAEATGAPLPDWMAKDAPSASERSEMVLFGGAGI